jgi:hypothetical protein
MQVIVGVAAASIAAAALALASVVLAVGYARLPRRMALQIGSDGALIGPGPRRNLWFMPAVLAIAMISPMLTTLSAARTNRPLSPLIVELSVGALVFLAFVSILTAANIVVVVRAAVTGRQPSAGRLAWAYRLTVALAFAAIAFLVWTVYQVAHPS